MTRVRIFIIALLLAIPALAAAQEANSKSLEKTLWDVDQQWLCAGPYQKTYPECVKFRSQYWVDGFFEVQSGGTLRNKEEMVATQSAANPVTGVRPYPADFKLVAVYDNGNIAVATDHTDFKTVGADGSYAFTADSHCLRVFFKQNGVWRPAAAGLVPIIPPSEASAKMTGANSTRSPDEKLEKELAGIDQKWTDSAREGHLDYLKGLFNDRWVEIVGWNPTVVLDKNGAMDVMSKLNNKNGEGVFSDEFKLMAVYGDVALAADRRIRKWTNEKGVLVSTPHRSMLIFVKENGQWKSAGGAIVPTIAK